MARNAVNTVRPFRNGGNPVQGVHHILFIVNESGANSLLPAFPPETAIGGKQQAFSIILDQHIQETCGMPGTWTNSMVPSPKRS